MDDLTRSIKDAMADKDMTIGAMCEVLGTNRTTFWRRMSDSGMWRVAELRVLAQVLDRKFEVGP